MFGLPYDHLDPFLRPLLPRFFLSQFLPVSARGIGPRYPADRGLTFEAVPFVERPLTNTQGDFARNRFKFYTPLFLDEKPRADRLSPASSLRRRLPYGNCATALLLHKSSEGVLMIPEVWRRSQGKAFRKFHRHFWDPLTAHRPLAVWSPLTCRCVCVCSCVATHIR